jgi:hypothetical protein
VHWGDGLFPGARGRICETIALQFDGESGPTQTVRRAAAHAGGSFERQFSLKCGLLVLKMPGSYSLAEVSYLIENMPARICQTAGESSKERRENYRQPHQDSPGARCALATSGFNSIPYPGLS